MAFDLDMTLIDPRAGVVATLAALSAETGIHVDGPLVASRLGPLLEDELANWFDAADVAAAADRFRELYAQHAIQLTVPLPGAVAAVRALRDEGVHVVVITAKLAANAALSLDRLGMDVDELHGWRWGPQKAETIAEVGACCYVGDHVADVEAACLAGVPAVAVTTGPCSREDLIAAGATVVLDSLHEFPSWWLTTRTAVSDTSPRLRR